LSWSLLRRDWRAGELRILAASLVLAVGSVTAVGFFTDRLNQGLGQQAAELLAADLVVSARNPFANNYANQARDYNLDTTQTQAFRSVVVVGDRTQLVEIKAVADGYPLRGRLRTAPALFADDIETGEIPAPGTAWVDSRLLQELQLAVGDPIALGNLTAKITRVLTFEPDRGGDFFSVGPRVLMNLADVDATGLIGVGSRVDYRLLVAGDAEQIKLLRSWLKNKLSAGENILDIKEGRPELRSALERATAFLGLAALVSVLLAGVAIATSAQRHAARHFDTSAIMRCLGAHQNTVLSLYLLEIIWLALLASTLGCAIGFIAQLALAEIMDQLVLARLPAPTLQPVILGYITGLIAIAGFALPPLVNLRTVPPLRVLRRELAAKPMRSLTLYAIALLSLIALASWFVDDIKLVFYVIAGMLMTVSLLAIAAWLLVRLLGPLRQKMGIAWRFGLANLSRHSRESIAQVVALGLGIMVILLLSLVRTDLLANWQRSLPPDAPNQFLINIQTDQVAALQTMLHLDGAAKPTIYPMIRARLTAINGEEVRAENYENARAQHLVTREFNLSWSDKPQVDNKIIEGRWWNPSEHGQPLLSLEEGIAKSLKIKLHDRVTFDVSGTPVELKVTSLRAVQWDTFNVNFFTVSPPGTLDNLPASWVTSLHIPPEQRAELAKVIRQFPNVTVIDVDALMSRVRNIMDRIALAVEFIFVFTLLAGLAVLYAVIQSSQDARRRESALLRTLGGKRKLLLQGLVSEFATLGGLSGVLAAFGASAAGYVLAENVFGFNYQLDYRLWLVGLLAGAIGVGIAGVLGTRSAMSSPPVETLRQN
jgi:putative ABC transport system permease protein